MKRMSMGQLLITGIPSISILIGVAIVSIVLDINLRLITSDVTAIAKINPLSGILSNFGIILWCASASICFFAAIAIRNIEPKDSFWFLVYSGFLSAYLLFDDFFQLHEILAGEHVGISEIFTYMALGMAVLIYLFIFRRNIWRTNFPFLLMAFTFLASSVATDLFQSSFIMRIGHWEFFIEEGTKWLGIACWCSYYVQTSYHFVVGTFLMREQCDYRQSQNTLDSELVSN